MTTILLTGFGPFPGSPFNPTTPLVRRLARMRRPALADVAIVAHVFATSYTAIDGELPRLVGRYKPDALLMFGLAPPARWLRIETRACNTVAPLPDVAGAKPRSRAIPRASRLHSQCRRRHVACSPPALQVCRPRCRAMRGIICVITSAGRRRLQHARDFALPPLSTCLIQAVKNCGRAKNAVSRWTISRGRAHACWLRWLRQRGVNTLRPRCL